MSHLTLGALMAALLAAGTPAGPLPATVRPVVAVRRKRLQPPKYKPHQGARERARRVRQMASGMLRPESRGLAR